MTTEVRDTLIIDDSEEDRTYLKRLLKATPDTSWRFAEVDTGAQALALLDEQHFDCVFLDQNLPDGTGMQILESLKTPAGDPRVAIVLLTGFGDETMAASALKAGAMDYLPKKGLTRPVVFHSVLNAMEKFRLLRQLRERADLLELTQDAILVRDSAGAITYWNHGAERLYGFRRDQALGQLSFSLLRSVFPGDLSGIETSLRESQYWEGELLQTNERGGVVPVFSRWALSRASDAGSSDLVLQLDTDITNRKRAEQELQAAMVLAEAANRAKSAFLAAISHEIRTPLTAILGVADLLSQSELNPTQRQYVTLFHRAGGNLLTLINNLLDMSRIESGHFELERIDFALEHLVYRTLELIRPKTEAKHISLISRIHPDTRPRFVGDPTRLQQILINLIGNAVKFTERGEVTLTITPSESDPSRLCFAVADTGIGIPGEQLETIFDDFTQAESSTTRRFGGTGLGLGICRRLVERMGGELKVRSEAGKGSTFYFDALFVMSSGAKIDRLEEFSVAGRRVLIVDDNPTNRLILSRMCAAWGMLPTESESAGAAVVTLPQAARNEQPFDLVIVDRVMPGADGFELVSEIRRLAPTMPILMLSSNGTPGDETRAHHLHLAGYALKPVAGDELLRIICDAFREMDHGQAASCVADRQTSQARILIADDSEDNRFLWQAYLANTSYEVVFAENGALAVELANVKPFDLILMDVQMPVMDGLCATRLIRRAAHEQGRSQVPVLALTANAREVDVEASLAAGCNAHLTKPILEAKLISAIEEYLQPVHGPILDPAPALAH